MKYVTRYERFPAGDFPMVCARSGLPATKMVSVEARRTPAWPWFFFPHVIIAMWVADSDRPWGLLPFAEGHVRGVTADYDKRIGVILNGVHPDFVAATRQAQGKPPLPPS